MLGGNPYRLHYILQLDTSVCLCCLVINIQMFNQYQLLISYMTQIIEAAAVLLSHICSSAWH